MQKIFHTEYDGTEYNLPYTIIKSKRKTCAISIDEECRITMRIPLCMNMKEAESFLQAKSLWLITHYLKLLEKKNSRPHSDLSAVQKNALEKRYKEAAREYIPKRVAYYHTITGGNYSRISIRSQKTRWGSCSSKGTLSFNWRLMLAPPSVLDYVVVHELCHLTHMNHSSAFWQAVEKAFPDYRNARKWLKDHGSELVL